MADHVPLPAQRAVVGYFSGPSAILKGMEKVKAANYQHFDAFTPFPVHGLEHAQGLKRSVLPWFTFVAGVTGALVGFGFQYWTSAVDWPLNIGGKPLNSWPAFIPVMFEMTVLFAGIGTFLGMIVLNRLPNVTKRVVDPQVTNDKFVIVIEEPEALELADEEIERESARYRPWKEEEAASLLRSAGATEVKTVKNEGWFA